jgi:hypothetical protein
VNQDEEHLRLLAIFHYIVAALAALFSFLPLLYTGMGALFVWAAQHPNPKQTGEPPPEFLGWIFIGLGSFFFLLGLAMALCILISARALAKRTRYWFVFVVACIECFFYAVRNDPWRIHVDCSLSRIGQKAFPVRSLFHYES